MGDEASQRPLRGKRVVVTRAASQSAELTEALQAFGASVLAFPTIRIRPVEGETPLDPAAGYDWVLFTSANAVDAFFRLRGSQEIAAMAKLGVVGPSTRQALERRGFSADLEPERFTGQGLFEALRHRGESLDGQRVVLPRSDRAGGDLPRDLREFGADVVERVTYRTERADPPPELLTALMAFRPDAVTFTSPSTVESFVGIVGDGVPRLGEGVIWACIGPVTAEAAEKAGLSPVVFPQTHDAPHLVQAIAAHFAV